MNFRLASARRTQRIDNLLSIVRDLRRALPRGHRLIPLTAYFITILFLSSCRRVETTLPSSSAKINRQTVPRIESQISSLSSGTKISPVAPTSKQTVSTASEPEQARHLSGWIHPLGKMNPEREPSNAARAMLTYLGQSPAEPASTENTEAKVAPARETPTPAVPPAIVRPEEWVYTMRPGDKESSLVKKEVTTQSSQEDLVSQLGPPRANHEEKNVVFGKPATFARDKAFSPACGALCWDLIKIAGITLVYLLVLWIRLHRDYQESTRDPS